jgi:hypothetical protein
VLNCSHGFNESAAPREQGLEQKMTTTYTYAADDEIEIRVNLEQSASPIEYRLIDSETWHGTPFQRADVSFETDAIATVNAWLDNA